ncbi:hypothetical protein BDY17DRAFT_81130 [Neohortaea acidophila]|uniref:Uncharacterized protein n=1 Tax=Neohortaea acidophila TaxID=245834 RepID=A0A6A6Q3B9_9PEZI|nr:uncharacterized protein BDY17DRAFT_81130 [Neohortaea acidophila]KAF2486541.1 hypothetical protein BDY17DRAFT_81130 [Neohortaea acidophila]
MLQPRVPEWPAMIANTSLLFLLPFTSSLTLSPRTVYPFLFLSISFARHLACSKAARLPPRLAAASRCTKPPASYFQRATSTRHSASARNHRCDHSSLSTCHCGLLSNCTRPTTGVGRAAIRRRPERHRGCALPYCMHERIPTDTYMSGCRH